MSFGGSGNFQCGGLRGLEITGRKRLLSKLGYKNSKKTDNQLRGLIIERHYKELEKGSENK